MYLLSRSDITNTSYGFSSSYIVEDYARRCQPTEYAKARGCMWENDTGSSKYGFCYWWVRSPGNFSTYAAYVLYDGYVYYFGIKLF